VDEIMQEFLAESLETVAGLEHDMSVMESGAGNPETLVRLYRGVHTIKGSCGFLGLGGLEALTVNGELLLSRLQSGKIGVTPERLALLGELVAAVRAHLGHLQERGTEDPTDRSQLIERLARVAEVPAAGGPGA
jgi:two-component system chemotaxis sensor kinase CheA